MSKDDFRAGLVIKAGMPDEVKEVVRRTAEYLQRKLSAEEYEEIQDHYYIHLQVYDDLTPPIQEWCFGSNYENGSHSVIYDVFSRQWKYRQPWDGIDTPIKGGMSEAIGHLCLLVVDV
jgi:hypothetical protein